jgi:hypothetical protein
VFTKKSKKKPDNLGERVQYIGSPQSGQKPGENSMVYSGLMVICIKKKEHGGNGQFVHSSMRKGKIMA